MNVLFYLPYNSERKWAHVIYELKEEFPKHGMHIYVATENYYDNSDYIYESHTDEKSDYDLKINYMKIISTNRFWENYSYQDIHYKTPYSQKDISKRISFANKILKDIDYAIIGHYDNPTTVAIDLVAKYMGIKCISQYEDYWHKKLYSVNVEYCPIEIMNRAELLWNEEQMYDPDYSLYKVNIISTNEIYHEVKYLSRIHQKLYRIKNKNISQLWNGAIEIISYLKSNKHFQKTLPSDKYAFFGMHYQPEALLLGPSKIYNDQLAVIRWISANMPINMKLVVKEYPVVYWRKPEYYKKILELPNVVLIDRGFDSKEIINGSQFVVTICGTIGFEALLKGKNVVHIQNIFYQNFPNVYHNNNDIFAALFEANHNVFDTEKFDKYLGVYQQALTQLSVAIPEDVGSLTPGWPQGVSKSYAELIKKLDSECISQ
jgi:hypothetical protein